jgi:hypothetical protein
MAALYSELRHLKVKLVIELIVLTEKRREGNKGMKNSITTCEG